MRNTIPHVKDFDPNAPTAAKTWGTFVPGRNPNWKTHTNRGPALNAVAGHQGWYGGGALFSMDDSGRWQRVATRLPQSETQPTCEHCGAPPTSTWDALKWVWLKESGRIADPPEIAPLCTQCQRTNR